ncbi:hypothetical protein [Candidatus Nitrosocosmicus arcticus]|uniref:C2H2-type domain-containing protein n=1 Tax=Candidatus Nitrosocosmicus arcticus TaxID=2035267 RepID=A0A557SX59_9ARCH|nr:hypothetical protein [Candidatus Nitrosocosmicus arcticus]TVP41184.1 hypothetical protein NARC_40147 [Candidatus Nitrosocosmicus arcticus]
MESKLYYCSMCKRKFRRKWNAFRHNLTVHSDLAKIALYPTNSSTLSLSPNRSKDVNKVYGINFHKFKHWESKYGSQDDDDILDYLLIGQDNNTDTKIMKIIGQMIKLYLDLQSSLDHADPETKARVLSTSFISSLLSYNPVKLLSEISDKYRSNMGLDLIAKHVSEAQNMPIHHATVLVKEAVRYSSLIRRINN